MDKNLIDCNHVVEKVVCMSYEVSSPKIHLIEDNDEDYDTFNYVLKKLGLAYTVKRYKTGRSAVDTILQQDHNSLANSIIFLDLNLPGMDGKAVLKALREDQVTRKVPIVVITTSKLPKDINECYEYGANTFVHKPLEFNKLKETIKCITDYWFNISQLPVPN